MSAVKYFIDQNSRRLKVDEFLMRELNSAGYGGVEIRKMAEKQGVDILMHSSLTIPMGIPERSDWRDAQDHIEKSIRSAVQSGAKYVDFHSCLNIWLELMTYTSRKLTMSFCDHEGHFISRILQQSKSLMEEIRSQNSQISSSLDQSVNDLRTEKMDRLAFANLLMEVAMRLKDEFKIPEVE